MVDEVVDMADEVGWMRGGDVRDGMIGGLVGGLDGMTGGGVLDEIGGREVTGPVPFVA